MQTRNGKYFAALEADKMVDILMHKAEQWQTGMQSSGYMNKLRLLYSAYHNMDMYSGDDGHQITFGGENGELTNVKANHLRNIARHMLNMATMNRVSFEVRATNTDYKSLVQTRLASGLLDYYMREKRLEDTFKRACEHAIAFGSGFIKLEWNATSGEIVEFNEDTQTEIYEGDIESKVLSPWDVVVDSSKENINELDWIIVRTFKNKFDIAAKFPELADKIIGLPSKSDLQGTTVYAFGSRETDDVPVYEFYHRKSEAIPDGRYCMYLSEDVIPIDTPLPYRKIPVYRISPSDILGTPYGYTPLMDLLPLQDALNMCVSTAVTNHNAFGVQHLLVPSTANITVEQLEGGLNIIEGNFKDGKPEAANFTATSPETYNLASLLVNYMETISGVNSTARGNPEKGVSAASALALLQSNAIQFMNELSQQYIGLVEDVGSGIISILKDYANTKRVVTIVGKTNAQEVKEFSGHDLSDVSRVIVSVGNPLSKTAAGRLQIASELLQYQLLTDPSQYFYILETGNLEAATEDPMNDLLLIRDENEKLMSGEDTPVLAIDIHSKHIKGHKSVLSDPELRKNPEIVATVLKHIQQHIEELKSVDPSLLQMIGEQSLAPPPGQQQPQGQPGDGQGAQPPAPSQLPQSRQDGVGNLGAEAAPAPKVQEPRQAQDPLGRSS